MAEIRLINGIIVDGHGGEPYAADVLIRDGLIAEIQRVKASDIAHSDNMAVVGESSQRTQTIDCNGKIIAPGFIDIHSHGDLSIAAFPEMESAILQGITTIFGGHCGMSAAPADRFWRHTFFEGPAYELVIPPPCGGQYPGHGQLLEVDKLRPAMKKIFDFDLDWTTTGEFYDHLEKRGIGANILMVVGHGMIRNQVMGIDDRREATEGEVAKMKEILLRELKSGAVGMSFGLDYESGVYAGDSELIELARCLAQQDGLLTTHCQRRNFRRGRTSKQYYINGLREVLQIAEKTGVRLHVSHLAVGYEVVPYDEKLVEEACQRTLDLIQEYRDRGVSVTWDVIPDGCGGEMFHFPYLAFKFQPYVDWCGGITAFIDKIQSGSYRRQLIEEIGRGGHRSVSPFTYFNPENGWGAHEIITKCSDEKLVGRSIAEIANKMSIDVVRCALEILITDPWTMYASDREVHYPGADYFSSQLDAAVCLDGGVFNYNWPFEADRPLEFPAPSTYCGMIKFLERELRAGRSIGSVIAKMTGNAAKKIGLRDRGYLEQGLAADVVVFDPSAIDPKESRQDPRVIPAGIEYVLVNGVIEVDHGRCRHKGAGKTLKL